MNLFHILQVVMALGLLNVWLIRPKQATAYRGGEAKTIVEEFAVYGLPSWVCYLTGFLKVSCAISLLAGLSFPGFTFPAAALLTILMAGAVLMHIKVKDPVQKSIPAAAMLLMSLIVMWSVRGV
jgi:hypothetical protein